MTYSDTNYRLALSDRMERVKADIFPPPTDEPPP